MFLSFIVPVYNVEKYLSECLDSLLEQDIAASDYEIICINDGSKDRSLQILREYASRIISPQITVIDKENAGVSAARNDGLNAARGEYVWMIDADDFIQRNCLGMLRRTLEQAPCDRLEIEAYTFQDALDSMESEEYRSKQIQSNHRYYDSVIWSSIFRKSFLDGNRLRFLPGIAYSEDVLFMMEVNIAHPAHHFLEKTLYFYRQNFGSAMFQVTTESMRKRADSFQKVLLILNSYYDRDNDDTKLSNLLMHFLWIYLHTMQELPAKERRQGMRTLRDMGMFPFERPENCTVWKSYATTRTDWIGRTFDWIYIRQHTYGGFFLMRCFKIAEHTKKRIVKLLRNES